jgi:HK97 family phage major capsid protein
MESLHQLRQKYAALVKELERIAVSNPKQFDKKFEEAERLKAQIGNLEKARALQASLARPAGGAGTAPSDGPFKSLAEQLLAIRRAAMGQGTDERLTKAPLGMGDTDPAAGGFAIQVDFANTILTRAYDMGEILSRVFKLPISENANGIKIPGIDETSRATGSRWGGVQMYWLGEGDSAVATRPKFRLIELDLKKLMGVWYVTDELLQDAAALTAIANEAFAEETVFMLEDSVIHGTGAGMPLGIFKSPALVVAAKDSGQPAKTVTWSNILNMFTLMWIRSRKNAVWYINQEIEPQLYQLSQVTGTGGMPVFLPAGPLGSQASGAPYASLLGRPVIPVEYAEALGTQGDIILFDPSQYVLADKNAMQQAVSIHIQFLTDQTAFRLTYRVDGEPIWHAPLTPFKGNAATKRSPYVVLASR